MNFHSQGLYKPNPKSFAQDSLSYLSSSLVSNTEQVCFLNDDAITQTKKNFFLLLCNKVLLKYKGDRESF